VFGKSRAGAVSKLLMLLLFEALLGLMVPAGADALYPYPVSVTVTGPGSVTDATGAINCPGTCSANYPSGQSATFTETRQSGQVFAGWSTAAPVISGCTSTSTTCEVKIDCDECGSSVSVAATFDPVLNVAVTGSGGFSGPGSLDCSSGLCSFTLTPGQQVRLTAAPASDYQFDDWSDGPCADQGPTCMFVIDSGQTITANFTQKENVSVYFGSASVSAADLGTLSDATEAINCPGACSAQFPTGAKVTLTYHPGLVGGLPTSIDWYSGCASSSGNTCVVDPKAVTDPVTKTNLSALVVPPIPVNVSPPTVTGTMTNRDYLYSKRFITNSSLTCHPGQWKGDPLLAYDWTYDPGPGHASTMNLDNGKDGVFRADLDAVGWDPGGKRASATCAVYGKPLSDSHLGTPVSVTVPVAPPRPVRLRSPQIGLHVAPGGSDICTAGTYKYLFGAGKFSYSWLLSGSARRKSLVGKKRTLKVQSSWLGKTLGCRVKVTPTTGWKPLIEYSKTYVVPLSGRH
jgi:Divergent InlB B-repeat domain